MSTIRKTPFLRSIKPTPRTRTFAAVIAATLVGFTPMKGRALENREPAPNPASWSDTQGSRIIYKRQEGTANHKLGLDTFKAGINPKFFGVTNSGPVFMFDYVSTRKQTQTLKFGVAEQFKIGGDTLLKLGLLSPTVNTNTQLKRSSFGVIISHGAFSAEGRYLGQVSGNAAVSGGAGVNLGRGVEVGFVAGSKGYSAQTDTVRYGLRLGKLEENLGLGKGALLRPTIDFGITRQREMPNAVDVGIMFSPNSRIKFGVDLYDAGSKTSPKAKTEQKVAGFIIFNF